ncbi:hypothetical protein CHS0354_010717 [Potamilus streckersoni]|uniref:TIR domain-containing protein n=1 Tax=Potamilus streckersoni TaxID=2493646 RepID=A0AAE0SV73_9BIVA|nr:hypothetical protein CHS0354_010717 [Potamilus streckersoni]
MLLLRCNVPAVAIRNKKVIIVLAGAIRNKEVIIVLAGAIRNKEVTIVPAGAIRNKEVIIVPAGAIRNKEVIIVPAGAIRNKEVIIVPAGAIRNKEVIIVPAGAIRNKEVIIVLAGAIRNKELIIVLAGAIRNKEVIILPAGVIRNKEVIIVPAGAIRTNEVIILPAGVIRNKEVIIVLAGAIRNKEIIIVLAGAIRNKDVIIVLAGAIGNNKQQRLLALLLARGHDASEPLLCEERQQHVIEEKAKHVEQRSRTKDPLEQTNFQASDLTEPEIYHLPLPPGKKYHVFFSYACPDIQWVKETVEKLENDHGFVCREYDRDNTPGSPLLLFAEHSIKYACKTVVVMTDLAFKSGFVQHEIQMALMQGFDKGTQCVVPVLLKDCTVPDYLRILNYVDVRDPSQRDIWWPKLLSMLRVQETLEATSTDALLEDKSIEAKTKHNHLCIKLDALITKDSLKSIKRMARSYIDRTILEKAESMDDLLSALEERGVIGVGHYTTLIDIMTYANVEIGRDEIHKTARDIKEIIKSSRE